MISDAHPASVGTSSIPGIPARKLKRDASDTNEEYAMPAKTISNFVGTRA